MLTALEKISASARFRKTFSIRLSWTMMTLLLLLMVTTGTAFTATLDPLLKSLLQAKASRGPGLSYEKFLAIDPSENPDDPSIGVILHWDHSSIDLSSIPGLVMGSRQGNFVTARLPLSSLSLLAENTGISHVEAAHVLHPLMDVATVDGKVDQVWNGAPAYTGQGVLVGVIDSGIDWTHADFKTAGGDTRIKYIWDQYVAGVPPTGFDYGAEYDQIKINAGNLTEKDLSGHGSHVAGIAAGNGLASSGQYSGVAPDADIIFAKAYDDQLHGFPEDKTIDAINYLVGKASTMEQPMAINMSLGGHLGAHDGTSAQEQIIDNLSGAGVVFCIAAGNEGEGYIHDSGPATGTDLLFNLPPFTANPGDGNDYILITLWVDGDTNPTVAVTYDGATTGPVNSGADPLGVATSHGTVWIDNASGGVNPLNGDKQILIQIDDSNGVLPGSGDWTFSVNGGSGTAHAWIASSTMTTAFPNSDQSYSVGMPGTSEQAITVAAHKTRQSWQSLDGGRQYHPDSSWGQADLGDYAPFSSRGPTRDDREKPDISAPGMGMFAPYSIETTPYPGDSWLDLSGDYLLSQGTSMASPFVCGVVALLFEKNEILTADQVRNVLRSSAVVDGYTGVVWNNRFGAGKIDALAAIAAISPPGPAPIGDVNGDSETSVLDLVLLVNYIVDPVGNPLDSEARTQGDVYPSPRGDGLLNASDLARIVSFILESDEPGFVSPQTSPVVYKTGQPVWQEGRWWQPVDIIGSGIAAGQFALEIEDAIWQPEDLVCENDIQLAATRVGSQVRVLLYNLAGSLPADGISLRIPFEYSNSQPARAVNRGLLMVDALGSPLDISETTAGIAGFLSVSPNPAPGPMKVSFARTGGRDYGLAVFNIRGRRVRNFRVDRSGDGLKTVIFDGRDDSGRILPAGVYFMQLRSVDEVISRKIVLTR